METDGFIFPSECDEDADFFLDNEMETVPVAPKEHNEVAEDDGEIPLETCADALKEVLEKYKSVKSQMKERETLASQVKVVPNVGISAVHFL